MLLSWAVQRGTSVVPKTVQNARLDENKELFSLDGRDMEIIDWIADEKGHVRFLDPRNHIGFDIFDETCDQPIAESE